MQEKGIDVKNIQKRIKDKEETKSNIRKNRLDRDME
jgi:hypothetical protein